MEKTKLGLIFLGIVALVAVIGLLLMLKGNITQMGVGGGYDEGIAPVFKLPPFRPGEPAAEFPAGPMETIGTRTPLMIFFKGTYGTIYESSQCWADLFPILPAPQDMFSCYVVPTAGVAEEVTGYFPPSSTALPKAPGGMEGRIGGDVYCYERTPRDRDQMMDKLKSKLAEKGWYISIVNNQEVLNCQKGKEFIYPQGHRPGYY
ncbi:Uncharacterised protein [uncultured archaeon]|nr:Uncharacterised protein [uncultured archaeon]